jgi:hypothetical protein
VDTRGLTPRLVVALLVVALALVLCTTASGTILFSTIARGETSAPDDRYPPRQAVFLARSPGAATAFTHLLRPIEKEAVQNIDWREYVVLAAIVFVPTACDPADIAQVSRRRTTLVVSVVVTRHVIVCPAVVGWRYHVVKLRRAALRPLPRRAVLKIVRWP